MYLTAESSTFTEGAGMRDCTEVELAIAEFRLGQADSFERFNQIEDVGSCVAEGMIRQALSENWDLFELYVIAAFRYPSRSMTTTLCGVLGRQIEDINNEDIVELLEIIADPAAVACIEHALWWQPEWDEYQGLGLKCVGALAAIGTDEALDALRCAAETGPHEVRKAAADKLGMGRP